LIVQECSHLVVIIVKILFNILLNSTILCLTLLISSDCITVAFFLSLYSLNALLYAMNMTCMFRSGSNIMFQSNYMTQYVTVISSKHRQSRFWITVVHAICPCLLSEIQSGKFVLFPSKHINFYTRWRIWVILPNYLSIGTEESNFILPFSVVCLLILIVILGIGLQWEYFDLPISFKSSLNLHSLVISQCILIGTQISIRLMLLFIGNLNVFGKCSKLPKITSLQHGNFVEKIDPTKEAAIKIKELYKVSFLGIKIFCR